MKLAPTMDKDKIIVVTVSGRGDKDCAAIARYRGRIFMSKIRSAFENGKAFIPFITCGDPNLEITAKIVREAVANGADLIELGIPFSDPTAEGPVIQGANVKALAAGVTTDKVFDLVRDLRKDVTIPMVFMTYANVVYSYGAEKFISTCKVIALTDSFCRISHMRKRKSFYHSARNMMWTLFHLSHLHQRIALR